MAGDVRGALQAAQDAENRGDVQGAVGHLMRAAGLYADAGRSGRAAQMLRHALRLDGGRADVASWLAQLESDGGVGEGAAAVASEPVVALDVSEDLERAMAEAVAHLEGVDARSAGDAPLTPALSLGGRETLEFVERGPLLAPEDAQAWCSFCCRPDGEVGRLVAGPAGAFICAGCVRTAAGLLGAEMPQTAGAPAPSVLEPASFRLLTLPEQQALLFAVGAARARGLTRQLLVGGEGSGRSTVVSLLAARDAASRWSEEAPLPPRGLLLVDDADRLTPGAARRLAEHLEAHPSLALVLVARGQARPPPLSLLSEGGSAALWTSAALLEAAPGLPVALAAHVQHVLAVALPSPEGLARLGQHLLQATRPEVQVDAALCRALGEEAARAPRGLHELVSLVRRLPPGRWQLAPVPPSFRPDEEPRP